MGAPVSAADNLRRQLDLLDGTTLSNKGRQYFDATRAAADAVLAEHEKFRAVIVAVARHGLRDGNPEALNALAAQCEEMVGTDA